MVHMSVCHKNIFDILPVDGCSFQLSKNRSSTPAIHQKIFLSALNILITNAFIRNAVIIREIVASQRHVSFPEHKTGIVAFRYNSSPCPKHCNLHIVSSISPYSKTNNLNKKRNVIPYSTTFLSLIPYVKLMYLQNYIQRINHPCHRASHTGKFESLRVSNKLHTKLSLRSACLP